MKIKKTEKLVMNIEKAITKIEKTKKNKNNVKTKIVDKKKQGKGRKVKEKIQKLKKDVKFKKLNKHLLQFKDIEKSVPCKSKENFSIERFCSKKFIEMTLTRMLK